MRFTLDVYHSKQVPESTSSVDKMISFDVYPRCGRGTSHSHTTLKNSTASPLSTSARKRIWCLFQLRSTKCNMITSIGSGPDLVSFAIDKKGVAREPFGLHFSMRGVSVSLATFSCFSGEETPIG